MNNRSSRVYLSALFVALLAAACTSSSTDSGSSETETETAFTGPDLSSARLVDLSYAFDDQTIYWPTSPSAFEIDQLSYGTTEAGFFYSANTISTPEHGGTHLDAPIHFAQGRWTTDEIPLDSLIGPAVVLDVSAQAAEDSDYTLSEADVLDWEQRYGQIPAGSIVLLNTGWGRFWPDRKAYLGDDTPGDASNLHFPSYGAEAARLLVEQRSVSILGVDTASIDHGPSTDFIVHQIANRANVAGLENVANLDELPPTGSWVMALPMKIAGGSGGPVRIVGLLWD